MRKSGFAESQIVEILKDGEGGLAIGEVIRKHGSVETRSSSGGASTAERRSRT
jgi:hypothetical protein